MPLCLDFMWAFQWAIVPFGRPHAGLCFQYEFKCILKKSLIVGDNHPTPWGMSWICTWHKCYMCVHCTCRRHVPPITRNELWRLMKLINHVELRSRILLCWVNHKGRHHGTMSVCNRFLRKEGKEACPKEDFRWRNTLQVLPLTFISSQTETTTMWYTQCDALWHWSMVMCQVCVDCSKDAIWGVSKICSMLQPLLVVWFSCNTIAIMI